jgi:hypothetical protein
MGLDLIAIKDAFFLHILQRSLRNAWNGLGIVFECSDTVLMPLVIMNLSPADDDAIFNLMPISLIVVAYFYISSAHNSSIKRSQALYK